MNHVIQSMRTHAVINTGLVLLIPWGGGCDRSSRPNITITSLSTSQPAEFCDEDRKIIETVLLSLIDAPEFNPMIRSSQPFTSIALNEASLPSLRIEDVCTNPSHSLVGKSAIEYRNHLIRRCEGTSFASQTWDSRILMLKQDQLPKDTIGLFDGIAFGKSYPGVRGWVQIGLPVYFNNGANAYLRIEYPRGMHGAGGDFILGKDSGRWMILWHEFQFYC